MIRQGVVLYFLLMGKTVEYTDFALVTGEKQGHSDKNQYC